MKLTILAEDQAKFNSRFLAEHGLSVLIEADKKVLFDVGQSDVFIKNAEKLGISLNDVDCVALSHGHFDHTDGLKFLKGEKKFKVIAHPACFDKKYHGDEYIGAPFSLSEMNEKFDLILSKEPYKISENMFFLGEVPRKNDFEAKEPVGYYLEGEMKKEDYVMDDTAIAVKTPNGLVIVTGCSHAGICNIVDYAKEVTGEKKVYAILGGFHLLEGKEQLEKTLEFLEKEKVEHLYPCHCTGLPALSRFYQAFNIVKICSGDIIEL